MKGAKARLKLFKEVVARQMGIELSCNNSF